MGEINLVRDIARAVIGNYLFCVGQIDRRGVCGDDITVVSPSVARSRLAIISTWKAREDARKRTQASAIYCREIIVIGRYTGSRSTSR